VLRDGKPLDRVGIGTFYFDTTPGAGLERRYTIVAVDSDSNHSAATLAVRQ
jgi:hypothetical protein